MADARKDLSEEEFRVAHHYYITSIVAESQVREEAQRRLTDGRKKENSVLHFHPYSDRRSPKLCGEDGKHEEYIVQKEEAKADG